MSGVDTGGGGKGGNCKETMEGAMRKLGNPLLEDFLDSNGNSYGVFSTSQEPGFINCVAEAGDVCSSDMYSLYVKNVPQNMDKWGLRQTFSMFGDVQDVVVGRNYHGGSNWGKVTFLTKREGDYAISGLNGEPPLFLQVSWYQSKELEHMNRRNAAEQRKFSKESNRTLELIKRTPKTDDISMDTSVCGAGTEFREVFPLTLPKYKPMQCYSCTDEGRLVCSVCMVWYCSLKCQNYSWPYHKQDCHPPPPLTFPDGSYVNPQDNRLERILRIQERAQIQPTAVTSASKADNAFYVKSSVEASTPNKTIIRNGDQRQTCSETTPAKAFISRPGIFLEEIPQPQLEENKVYKINVPVEGFVSPSEFSLVLECSRGCMELILKNLSCTEPDPETDWKINRQQLVRVHFHGAWHRGVATKKKNKEYTIYLLDLGLSYNCDVLNLRPLSQDLHKFPVCALQVCLADVSPVESDWSIDDCAFVQSFINNSEGNVEVIIKGRESSGRLAVDVIKNGGLNLKDLLLKTQRAVDIKFLHFDGSLNLSPYPILADKIVDMTETMCVVTHVVDPGEFYILPLDNLKQFERIMEGIQGATQKVEDLQTGQRCLAFTDQLWHRVEVKKISADRSKAKVFCIDRGMTEVKELSSLRKLDPRFNVDGLVDRVGLSGIQPKVGAPWSSDAKKAFNAIIDTENMKQFAYKLVEADKVDLTDLKLGSVRDRMIKDGHATEKEELAPSESGISVNGDVRKHDNPLLDDSLDSEIIREDNCKSTQEGSMQANASLCAERPSKTDKKLHKSMNIDYHMTANNDKCNVDRPVPKAKAEKNLELESMVKKTLEESPKTEKDGHGSAERAVDKSRSLHANTIAVGVDPPVPEAKVEKNFKPASTAEKTSEESPKTDKDLLERTESAGGKTRILNANSKAVDVDPLVPEPKVEKLASTVEKTSEESPFQELNAGKDLTLAATKEALEESSKVVHGGAESSEDKSRRLIENTVAVGVDPPVPEPKAEKLASTTEKTSEVRLKTDEDILNTAKNSVDQSRTLNEKTVAVDSGEKDDEHEDLAKGNVNSDLDDTEVLISYVINPEAFYFTPVARVKEFEEILTGIQEPCGDIDSIKVGEICVSRIEEIWFRAEIIKISPDKTKVKVFFMDTGRTETRLVSNLKKLDRFRDIPGIVQKAGLHGIGPQKGEVWSNNAIEDMKELVNVGGDTRFKLSLVNDEDETLKINLIDNSGMDLAQALTDLGVARKIEVDAVDPPPGTVNPAETKTEKKVVSFVDLVHEKPLVGEEENAAEPTVPENVASDGSKCTKEDYSGCYVSSVVDLYDFFITPIGNMKIFGEILENIQAPSSDIDLIAVEAVCVCQMDGVWCRARITDVSPDKTKVKIVFIDDGSTVTKPVSDLKKLEKFRDVPGLVKRAGLHGIRPLEGNSWSKEAVEAFKELVNVGCYETELKVNVLHHDENFLQIQLVDSSGLDIADTLVELGLATKEPIAPDNGIKTDGAERLETNAAGEASKVKSSNISTEKGLPEHQSGNEKCDNVEPAAKCNDESALPKKKTEQFDKCAVTSIIDLNEFFVIPMEKLGIFEEIMINVQSPTADLDTFEVGDYCVCPIDGLWYRANIVKVSADKTKVDVFLVDTGRSESKPADTIKKVDKFEGIPGLAKRAGLYGVVPKEGETWSKEAIEAFKEIVEVGELTEFTANVVSENEDSLNIQLVDSSGIDVAQALIDLDLASGTTP